MLTGFIKSATEILQTYANQKFITQTWDFFMDGFPGQKSFDAMSSQSVTEGKLSEILASKDSIEIPLFPLQSVTYLKTYDDLNADYTMSATDYFVDTSMKPGRLALTNNATWPTTFLRPVKGVQIRFVCGYGATSASIPPAIVQAIKQTVGMFYNQRGCVEAISALPPSVTALLRAYMVYRI